MTLRLGAKECFVFVISVLILTDLAILLNISFMRQIIGFFFLTILPGLLILQVLQLDKIGSTEKLVLSVGLSTSFLIFIGLFINNLSLSLGYLTPLATIPLLISINLAFIVLAIIAYKINKTQTFSIPNLNLTTSEKAFLIVPILFPALSIFGMHVMNTTNNNIILMFLLFLIPIYVTFVCFFNHKFSKRLYPVVIFMISISLLLLLSLRSDHLIGCDTHYEYYFFQTTLNNSHWSIFSHTALDACLSISLLPTIYQSVLNTSPEFLFKILYSLIFSASPLIIYLISKKYIEDSYAFLASFFFMSQGLFLYTAANSRATMAILFFALAMMTLFKDNIDPLKKSILFIVFMASCMVSHYSTAYIFFFIMLGTLLGMEILSKKYMFKRVLSLTVAILFFALIFFWYSQVTKTAFDAGVTFIENTLTNLNDMFIEESRSEGIQSVVGGELRGEVIPYKINFFFNWATIAFIGIGIITLIRRYKEMSFPELNFKKVDFLKEKFEVEYFIVAVTCIGIIVAVVMLPHLTVGYDLSRPYTVAIVILSIFFVIGGIMIAKYLNQLIAVLQGKASAENPPQVRIYFVILLVLFPYFLCITGVTYTMFGEPRSLILSSEGGNYELLYVHDQETYGAKWLMRTAEKNIRIHADHHGMYNLISQGMININSIDERSLFRNEEPPKELRKGYIYLRYVNTIQGKLMWSCGSYNTSEISRILHRANKIYDNDAVIYKIR